MVDLVLFTCESGVLVGAYGHREATMILPDKELVVWTIRSDGRKTHPWPLGGQIL